MACIRLLLANIFFLMRPLIISWWCENINIGIEPVGFRSTFGRRLLVSIWLIYYYFVVNRTFHVGTFVDDMKKNGRWLLIISAALKWLMAEYLLPGHILVVDKYFYFGNRPFFLCRLICLHNAKDTVWSHNLLLIHFWIKY